MKNCIGIVFFITLMGSYSIWAGPQMQVTLKDNSVLRGELVELKDGIYRLKTDALGEIKIPADRVAVISTVEEAPLASDTISAPNIREGIPQPRPPIPQQPQKRRQTPQSSSRAENQAASSRQAGGSLAEQQSVINTQVQSMMMDGNFLQKVTDLGESSNMQNVMQDEEIMEAIQNGDYEFLMNNEKMKELMDSPEMQDILHGTSE